MASLLGVPRHRVTAWFAASTDGSVTQALACRMSSPPVHRRITETAVQTLQTPFNNARGCAGYDQIRQWFAEEQQGHVSYVSVQALIQYKLQLLPVVRRRITAREVQPLATVLHTFATFYICGAVAPTTGASCFLELLQLPSRTLTIRPPCCNP